ncbi:hypothetical protein CDIK_1778 [Cucumispora dikerogammari]|nr:hypothetical protein CDIK_1778 [Cucumispora dikerogammari]
MFTRTEIESMNKKLNLQFYKTKEINKKCVMLVNIIKKYKNRYLVTDTFSYFYIELDLKNEDITQNKSFLDFEKEDCVSDSDIAVNDFVSSDLFSTNFSFDSGNMSNSKKRNNDSISEVDSKLKNTNHQSFLSSLHYSDLNMETSIIIPPKRVPNSHVELLIYRRYKVTGVFDGMKFVVHKVENVNYKELCNRIFPTYLCIL